LGYTSIKNDAGYIDSLTVITYHNNQTECLQPIKAVEPVIVVEPGQDWTPVAVVLSIVATLVMIALYQ